MFCARCGSNQDDEAVLCNQCGYIMDREKYAKTPGTFVPERKNAPVADPPRKAAGAGCLLVLVVMACLYLFACNGINDIFPGINPTPTSAPTPTPDPRYQVYGYAKEFVERALKAPSTAKYPSIAEWKFGKTDKGYWAVTAYVDSENSFGAMMRSDFYIEMLLTDNGATAKPLYFIFDGEVVYDLRP